jgi:hypothetical protein
VKLQFIHDDQSNVTMAEVSSRPPNNEETIQRLSVQLKKLTEANNKYKNILKLVRDRLQENQEELALTRSANVQLQTQLEEKISELNNKANNSDGCKQRKDTLPADAVTTISNVYQRAKVAEHEIWALIEFRVSSEESPQHNKKYKEWVSFNSESQLEDFIRKDTGEPLTIPTYSMTPEQSARIEQEAEQRVSKITEEFRRFRVKSELAKKQMETQIREFQSAKNQTAAQQMDDTLGQPPPDGANGRAPFVSQQQLERLKAEMATQEAYWKESYETLLAENKAMKETGSEALLASQWRQRYETCKSEKEALEQSLKPSNVSGSSLGDAEKYEQKYRDLKGAFRCYYGCSGNIGQKCPTYYYSILLFQNHFDCIEKRRKRYLKPSN